jgi:hypothetical protein
VMASLSLRFTAILIAGALTAVSGSFAFAQKADASAQAQSDRYPPLPPDQQHRETKGTDNRVGPYAKEVRPTDREKSLDRKINNICRGC